MSYTRISEIVRITTARMNSLTKSERNEHIKKRSLVENHGAWSDHGNFVDHDWIEKNNARKARE